MKINLLDIELFIKQNYAKEVTNPIFIDRMNIPTEDGLFSTSIFGNFGTFERRNTFGYIELGDWFFNPSAYRAFKKLDSKYVKILSGMEKASLDRNGYVVLDEKGSSGIDFFYKNWEKIKFKRNDSRKRNLIINVLEGTDKKLIFTKKYLVLPAAYRDINLSEGKDRITIKSTDEVNEIYTRLINLSYLIKEESFDFNFMNINTKFRIQETILEIYEYLTSKLAKKQGMIKQAMLSKTIDYSVRSVISCNRTSNVNSYKEQEVSFDHSGIPLTQICVLFFPFIAFEFTAMINQLEGMVFLQNKKNVKLNLREYFTTDKIKNIINAFIKAPEDRLNFLEIDGQQLHIKRMYSDGKELYAPITLLEWFYILAHKAVIEKPKHVFITRYPIENYQSIYPSKIRISTLSKTSKVKLAIADIPYDESGFAYHYDNFPDLRDYILNKKVPIFIDTVHISNLMTESLGADFDGKLQIFSNILL